MTSKPMLCGAPYSSYSVLGILILTDIRRGMPEMKHSTDYQPYKILVVILLTTQIVTFNISC